MEGFARILEAVPEESRATARQLVTELRFMHRTLVKLRKEIDANGTTEVFDNGRQTFTRTTPAFTNYVALSGKFSTYHRQLTQLVPRERHDVLDDLDEFLES